MSLRKNLDCCRFWTHPVEEIVVDAGKVKATDTGKFNVPSLRADRRL